MPDNHEYVKPPKSTSSQTNNITHAAKGLLSVYDNLQPSYWKRKIPHLIIVIPVVWLIYFFLMLAIFGTKIENALLVLVMLIIPTLLTLISVFFYPYSLFWYKRSFIGVFLNNLYYMGGCLAILLKAVAIILGGVIIAGVLSPITGVLTWQKYKRKNLIIGEPEDFE